MTEPRFIIFSPGYHSDIGGTIVLHKLCDQINSLGFKAYLVPHFQSYLINERTACLRAVLRIFEPVLKRLMRLKHFNLNPNFNTPVINSYSNQSNDIVIYPEGVKGNPLDADNVVRWFLHKPEFSSNQIFYGVGELYFDYKSFVDGGACFYKSKLSQLKLFVTHFPVEIYNLEGALDFTQRQDVAYCVRKGQIVDQIHSKDAICIDGLSHHEIAKIFKRSKLFISYDLYTGYGWLAALCGCPVVVVPQQGVTAEQWYYNKNDRLGLAYGFEDISFSIKTISKVKKKLEDSEMAQRATVNAAIVEMMQYFNIGHEK